MAAVEEQADQKLRNGPEGNGSAAHGDERKAERDPAGPGNRGPVPLTGGDADAAHARLADAQRDHEGDGRQLQGDAMGCKGNRSQPAHHQCRSGEQEAFGHDGRADGCADLDDREEIRPVRPPDPSENGKAAQTAVPRDINREQQEAEAGCQDRGNGRPHQLQPWEAEIAENQQIVETAVEEGGKHRDPEHHLRQARDRQEGAQRHDRERREQRPLHHPDIGPGGCRNLRFLPQNQEDILAEPQEQPHRPAVTGHDPQPHADGAAHGPGILAPARGRCQRHDGLADAHAEHPEQDIDILRQNHGAKLDGTKPAHHDHVGGVDGHLRQLGTGQWQAQHQRRADITEPEALRRKSGRGIRG